jgi:hypothetical protein
VYPNHRGDDRGHHSREKEEGVFFHFVQDAEDHGRLRFLLGDGVHLFDHYSKNEFNKK